MTTPKHRISPCSSYFVTTKCGQSRTIFQLPAAAEICVGALLHYRDQGAYLLHEFVIMPDHLHLLLTPGATTSLEKAIQFVKGGSSHRIHRAHGHSLQIWQDGFFDWTIRDENDWRIKADYIRMNPVKAGLVVRAEDWKYGAANGRYVMDDIPRRYSEMSSGTEAPCKPGNAARGLKPPPPSGSDDMPRRHSGMPSGAEAPFEPGNVARGLKPPSWRVGRRGAAAPAFERAGRRGAKPPVSWWVGR